MLKDIVNKNVISTLQNITRWRNVILFAHRNNFGMSTTQAVQEPHANIKH